MSTAETRSSRSSVSFSFSGGARSPASLSQPQSRRGQQEAASFARPKTRPSQTEGQLAHFEALVVKDKARTAYHLVWISSLLLLAFGLCMLLSVSVAVSSEDGGKFVYVKQQGIAALVGLVCLAVAVRLNYRRLKVWLWPVTGTAVMLLLLVHVPSFGQSRGGSTSWLDLGLISLQPSEFAKLAVVILGSYFLSRRRSSLGDVLSFVWPFGAIGIVFCVLVVLEGDLGTALIIAGVIVAMFWLAGMKAKHWFFLTGAGLASALALVVTSQERMSRFLVFWDPSRDPHGSGYQLMQSLIALGRGGWFGAGPGQSIQKFQYLPEAHTDMIFSILGEELGLVGSAGVILLFVILGVASWRLASSCADGMGKLLIGSCAMLITLQAAVNIGGVTGALPLTGVPLPFVSYGRSSLVVMLTSVGLILSVARRAPAVAQRQFPRFDNVTNIDSWRRNRGTRRASAGLGGRPYEGRSRGGLQWN